MGYLVIAVVALLVILGIFGASSMAQSYATAEQARAQIEVAKVAQINATGNLITILTLTLVIVAAVAILAAIVFLIVRRNMQRSAISTSRAPSLRSISGETPQLDTNQLIQLILLEKLSSMDTRSKDVSQVQSLPAPGEQDASDQPFHWLR